eukprot:2085629-Amphidinium_carterae.1
MYSLDKAHGICMLGGTGSNSCDRSLCRADHPLDDSIFQPIEASVDDSSIGYARCCNTLATMPKQCDPLFPIEPGRLRIRTQKDPLMPIK